MEAMDVNLIRAKLGQFLSSKEVEELMGNAITASGLAKKDSYSQEEIGKILDRMIVNGGFGEFVARNLKVKLVLKG